MSWLHKFPNHASKPYIPSNGTEGMCFVETYCNNCINECPSQDGEPKCEILTRSFLVWPEALNLSLDCGIGNVGIINRHIKKKFKNLLLGNSASIDELTDEFDYLLIKKQDQQ